MTNRTSELTKEQKRNKMIFRLTLVSIVGVAAFIVSAFVAHSAHPEWFSLPKDEQGIYIGRLSSVHKIHNGMHASISDTELHFADGNVFTIGGDWDFPLNATLKVTYKYHNQGSSVVVEEVLKVEQAP